MTENEKTFLKEAAEMAAKFGSPKKEPKKEKPSKEDKEEKAE